MGGQRRTTEISVRGLEYQLRFNLALNRTQMQNVTAEITSWCRAEWSNVAIGVGVLVFGVSVADVLRSDCVCVVCECECLLCV